MITELNIAINKITEIIIDPNIEVAKIEKEIKGDVCIINVYLKCICNNSDCKKDYNFQMIIQKGLKYFNNNEN